MKNNHSLRLLAVFLLLLGNAAAAIGQVVFEEGFEVFNPEWSADNGSWETGEPSNPPGAFQGSGVAATVLAGNYPMNANTRFAGPQITLPTVSGDEKIKLKFWHWFAFGLNAKGRLQVSVDNGPWETISGEFDDESGAWTQHYSDLTGYAGSSIRVGFYFTSQNFSTTAGWYVDEISIHKENLIYSSNEGFESGIQDWYADNGCWETGPITGGIPSPFSGGAVAATVLDGDYPMDANTRLVSPEIDLPTPAGSELIKLKFWHWFAFGLNAKGRLQVSVDNGPWETISGEFDDESGAWTQHYSDLTGYAGSSIRVGFYFTSQNFSTTAGWYVDEISITHEIAFCDSLEGFESGFQDWYAENGAWEIGAPSGTPAAYSGQQVAGTVLSGNYPMEANTRLVSPEIILEPSSPLSFRFWHWYSFGLNAQGLFQIKVNGGDWTTIGGPYDDASNVWTFVNAPIVGVAGAGDTVQVAFYFTSQNFSTSTGWYIDEVELFCSSTPTEICNNGEDDDGDNLTDCDDPDCSPTIGIGSNSPLCAGETLNLSSGPDNANTFDWAGPAGFTSAVPNPSRPGATTDMSGTYSVTVTNSSGCSNEASVEVTVNPLPTATASNSLDGQTLQLLAGGGTGYAWGGPDGFTSTQQNPAIQNPTSDNSGTYTVTVTHANGCTDVATTFVSVEAEAIDCDDSLNGTIDLPGGEDAYYVFIEKDSSFDISLDSPGEINPAISVISPGGNILDSMGSTGFSLNLSISSAPETGVYYFIISDNGGDNTGAYELSLSCSTGCAVEIISVAFSGPITPPGYNDGEITITATGQNLEYSIDGGGTYQTGNSFENLVAGVYDIRVRITGTECFADYMENPVILIGGICEKPEMAWLSAPSSTCPESPFQLCTGATDFNYNYVLFQNGGATGEQLSGNGESLCFPPIMIEEKSTFSLTAICKSDPSQFFIHDTIITVDVAGLSMSATSFAEQASNNNGRINLCIESGAPPFETTWTPNRGFLDPDVIDPFCAGFFAIDGLKAGYYEIEVEDSNGCQVQEVILVENPDKPRIGFPEKPLLTPNGDNINDHLVFEGLYEFPDASELVIYTRYGSVIYEAKPYFPPDGSGMLWDATWEGDPVPAGTYFYALWLTMPEGEKIEYRGYITVVR